MNHLKRLFNKQICTGSSNNFFLPNCRISNLSDVVDTLPSLEARVAAAESARVEVQMELAREQARGEQAKAERSKAESETQGVVAELDATKKALKSLLDSLDSRQKYEALLQEHNKGELGIEKRGLEGGDTPVTKNI